MTMFTQFVQFVKEQDSEREIDHHGWECCAVGEFYESIGKPFCTYGGFDEIFGLSSWHDEDIDFRTLEGCIYYGLNHSEWPTYGGIQDFIEGWEDAA